MNRLAIAREDQTIRESIPVSSFKSNVQARQEMAMRQMLSMRRGSAEMREAAGSNGMGGGSMAGSMAGGSMAGMAGRGAGGGALRTNGKGQGAGPESGLASPAGPSRLGQLRPAVRPAPAPAPAAMPFVYRRAAFDIQIADPASSDILMLDKGTWVLSAAEPHPVTNMLQVFTTDQETGKVLVYELPIPEGNMAKFFDRHTLNVVETMAAEEQFEDGSGAPHMSGYE